MVGSKRFFALLVLFSLALSSLFSADVHEDGSITLTAQERQEVDQALSECEIQSMTHEQESEEWQMTLLEADAKLEVSEIAFAELEIYWQQAIVTERRNSLWKGIAIGGGVTLAVGGLVVGAIALSGGFR